jgi:protein SCO1/2
MKSVLVALIALVAILSGSPCRATTNSSDSVYDLGQTWTNQDGKAVAMSDLRGKVRIVAMFFTSCRYACPRITADMKAIEAKLTPAQKEKIGFTMFSFDADADQPPRLKDFARNMHLDESRWTLLHGPEESVRELAAVLGISYRREIDGSFSHGNAITVLDGDGAILLQQPGLGADPAATLDALAGATKK